MNAISAMEAIMQRAPTVTPTVTQITPAVPAFVRPYCAVRSMLFHLDWRTITKPTMEMKRKFRCSVLVALADGSWGIWYREFLSFAQAAHVVDTLPGATFEFYSAGIDLVNSFV